MENNTESNSTYFMIMVYTELGPLKIICLTGYSLAAITHALGLLLVYKAKSEVPNQRIIIMNLALSEMLLCIWIVASYIIPLSMDLFSISDAIFYVECFFQLFLYSNVRFVIMHIIIDRFLYIRLNIKYSVYMNTRNLAKIIIAYWFCSIIIGMVFTLLLRYRLFDVRNFTSAYAQIILTLDVLVVSLAIMTYIYLFWKVKKIGRPPSLKPEKVTVLFVWLKLKTPALITVTFIMFNFSATVIHIMSIRMHESALVSTLNTAAHFLNILGWLSDAVLYIFLQKQVRDLLLSMFKKSSELEVPLEMNELCMD